MYERYECSLYRFFELNVSEIGRGEKDVVRIGKLYMFCYAYIMLCYVIYAVPRS